MVPVAVKWWVFDVIQNATPSTDYGLAVWNESGSLVFDSARLPLRIVDTISGSTWASTHTYPTDREYAVIFGMDKAKRYEISEKAGDGTWDNTVKVWHPGARVSGGDVILDWAVTNDETTNSTTQEYPQAGSTIQSDFDPVFYVVDVTNY